MCHAVLHQLLRLVRVGAQFEGDAERHQAVGGGLAAHVEHAVNAIDGFFQRRRHRFGNHLRVGAGVLRAHNDGGGHHIGVLGDGQCAQGDQPGDKHEQ